MTNLIELAAKAIRRQRNVIVSGVVAALCTALYYAGAEAWALVIALICLLRVADNLDEARARAGKGE